MEWEYHPDETASCYRIGEDRKGFWNGMLLCSLPTQAQHKVLFERVNGLPIDLGYKQVIAEVSNDLIDFAHCQIKDSAPGLATPAPGAPSSSADGNAPPAQLAPTIIPLHNAED